MPNEERCEFRHPTFGQCTKRWMHDENTGGTWHEFKGGYVESLRVGLVEKKVLGVQPKKMPTSDAVNHPSHYGGDTVYEVIKVLHAWGLEGDALLWNCIKYVARAGKKDRAKTIEDLRKARFYLDRRITNLEAGD